MSLFTAGIPLGIWLFVDVPETEIKYAEFSFTLTYEVNGETKKHSLCIRWI